MVGLVTAKRFTVASRSAAKCELMMFANGFERLYHYHLKKCGGTSLNAWLDTHGPDSRSWDPSWVGTYFLGDRTPAACDAAEEDFSRRAKAAFYWSDIVHSHAPLRGFAPPRTFSFTVLRRPVERLLSQVSDWRRLKPHDLEGMDPGVRQCVVDAQRLPLRDFLEQHCRASGTLTLDNYMVRALAASRVGPLVMEVQNPRRLLDAALQSLEQDFDFVGLTERHWEGRNAICALLGLPPAGEFPELNVTGSRSVFGDDVWAAQDLLDEMTRLDSLLYECAWRIFEERHVRQAKEYDDLTFERDHAETALRGLPGHHRDGAVAYSVRSPIVGSGFHGRDAARSDNCLVWTGPAARSVLYIPVPPRQRVSLLLWVRGYASEGQRETLRLKVDGNKVTHRFEHASGYRDLVVANVISARNFAKVEIEVDETLGTGTPGAADHDDRKRAVAFDHYGWRSA